MSNILVRLRRAACAAIAFVIIAAAMQMAAVHGQIDPRATVARSHVQLLEPDRAILHTGATPQVSKDFATEFPRTENPISENGAWRHLGTAWARIRSVNHHAIGTQTGAGGYDDSYAYLTGFGPDQIARATLWFDRDVGADYREVELLLHWADAPAAARGYECNLAWNGAYAEIVRWNGPFGDFNYITRQREFPAGLMPPRSGDIFTASISGSTIRVYLNRHDGNGDQLIATGTDGTFTDGGPGMGFFVNGRVDPARFGFSRFSAESE